MFRQSLSLLSPQLSQLPRGLFLIEGKDAAKYLRNLTTNDTNLLANGGEGIFTMLLNHQGRVICDAFIYPNNSSTSASSAFSNESFFLDCDPLLLGPLTQHLKLYKIRAKVTLENVTEKYAVWAGWDSEKDASSLPTWSEISPVGCVDPRLQRMGVRVVLPAGKKPQVTSGFQEVPPSEYLIHRILNGVGEGPGDMEPLASLPLESNVDYMNGVNFDKGCYLGQELTARTFHRGVTRKRILPVQFFASDADWEKARNQTAPILDRTANFSLPAPHTSISAGSSDSAAASDQKAAEKEIGVMGSSVHNIGLALMRLNHVQEGKIDFRVSGVRFKPFIPSWWPKTSPA